MKHRTINKPPLGLLIGATVLMTILSVPVGADDCQEAIVVWDWYTYSWVCVVRSGGGPVCISCDGGTIDVYPDQNTP